MIQAFALHGTQSDQDTLGIAIMNKASVQPR
jgi:hypothetical protein